MPTPDLNRALDRIDPALRPFLTTIRACIEGDVWVAGGFVRDVTMRRRPYDLDLTVAGSPRAVAAAVAAAFDGSPFVLDEGRETFRVALPGGHPLRTVDVSALRGTTIAADLAERDFTLNAMAASMLPPGLGPLIDPLGGRKDALARSLRMGSERALRDDPLRLLRAVRLAVELGCEIEDATAAAIRSHASLAGKTAGERQRDELMRILATSDAHLGLRLMDSLGLLDVLLPELGRARGVSQPERFHSYDVFDHCLEALAVSDWLLSSGPPVGRMPRAMRRAFREMLAPFGLDEYFGAAAGGSTRLTLTKLATLLHDVSKPETKAADETGRIRFLGHSEKGAAVGRTICRRLRMGNRETGFVAALIEEHLRPAQLSQSGAPTDRAIFRFFRDLGDAATACLVLSVADAAAAMGPRLTLSRWKAELAYIGYVLARANAQTEVLAGRHFVSGDTLIRALGMAPGPEVGRLLAALDEAAATGELGTEEEAIQLAKDLRQQWRRQGREQRSGVA